MAVVVSGTQATALASPIGSHDRLFYGSVAIAAALITFIGFGPSYYFRFFDGGPRATLSGIPFSPIYHLHGALFSSWVLLFLIQAALISSRRLTVHRRLGVFGGVLATAMVVVGVTAGIVTAKHGGAPAGMDPLAFLIVPLGDMAMFGPLVAAAFLKRRDKEAHKRLMLLAYASLLPAPTARIRALLFLGPLVSFAIGYSFPLAGAMYDRVSRGRVHLVYKWGVPLLFLSVPIRMVVMNTGAWHAFARFLVDFVG
jgi:uncharacterized membrane protein YozB (DUF420 family)